MTHESIARLAYGGCVFLAATILVGSLILVIHVVAWMVAAY